MTENVVHRFCELYGAGPSVVARAPGRIEVIGNHTDYNGGPVIGAAIDRSVWVAFRERNDGRLNLASMNRPARAALNTGSLRRLTGEASWANYPLGVWVSLNELGMKPPQGGDYLAASNLPAGAGLSSSAAIEIASALAFLEATGQRPPREKVAELARLAENRFVGVPCGILDQGVSAFGRQNHLVFIDCRAPFFETVPLPTDAVFWIFNTHARHELVDSLYSKRHEECTVAARQLGVELLADASADLLDRHTAVLSRVSLNRARHVIEEITRVGQVRSALAAGDFDAIGPLLTQSHRSSQHLFENSTPELDHLVDLLTVRPHVLGARLTGGGFGGAVLALTDSTFDEGDAAAVASQFAGRFGSAPEILRLKAAEGAEIVISRR